VKSVNKLAAVTVIAVGAVAAVRKFDLLNKGKALAEQGAEWLTAKADELAEKVLASVDQAGDPAADDDAEAPASQGRSKDETTYKIGDVR
jgi:hypothetical protein